MGQLCIYLPPFTSDYSGACSALFDLDCMMIINDASCCTSNYVFYDEPRWQDHVRPVLNTSLRSTDAIFGNDEKIVKSACMAAENIDSELVALIGTPVPAITGMDMEGLASEIEAYTGKKCIGLATDGFGYYDDGIAQAGKALIDTFTDKKQVSHTGGLKEKKVNIIGMTPIDYGTNGNDDALRRFVEGAGHSINSFLFMGSSLDDIRRLPHADMNIAVSASGIEIAKYLKKKFGTPYICGFPVGEAEPSKWFAEICTGMTYSNTVHGEDDDKKRLLIVTDQVLGNAIRDALLRLGCDLNIDVASFFGWDRHIAQAGDRHLESEKEYLQLVSSGRYGAIAADPLIMRPAHCKELLKFELPHSAISGKLTWDKIPCYIGAEFEQRMRELVQELHLSF